MKTIFSTGEAAEICGISQQTIIRCFDSGRLKGFKVPGSKFRRVPRESLIRFMRNHSIPMDKLDMGKQRILLIGLDMDTIADAVSRDPLFEVKHAPGGFEAGLLIQEFSPDVLIIGKLDSETEGVAICRAVRQIPVLERTVILLTGKRTTTQVNQLIAAGATDAIKPGTSVDELIQQITDGITV